MNSKIKKLLGTGLVAAALVGTIGWMAPVNYYQLAVENDFIRSVKKKLTAYNQQLPEDRVYVQFDKPMYEPGDNIWFNAFVRNGSNLKASDQSDIVHVDLINPKGSVERTLNLIAKKGMAAGDFSIGAEAAGGVYKVRAYTNVMKNDGPENYFEKEIQVQDVILPRLKMKLDFERKAFGAGDEVVAKLILNTNENKPLANHEVKFVANVNGQKILANSVTTDADGLKYIRFKLPEQLTSSDGLLNVMIDYEGSTESVSRSIPIVLNKIKLEIFPEGGDLVQGLESRVAFKAVNEFNKPADVEGVVQTAKGSTVASFSSFHQGMGAFKIIPQEGETYLLKITKPEGIKETFLLPEVYARGYTMTLDNDRKNELTVNINTTETEELSLLAQVRGKIYYSTAVDAVKGNNKLTFSTKDFPIGVTQITLFDGKGIPRAERLAFVNKDKQLNISVSTNKEKYLPREKVLMTISVKDERGIPMPANVSMAVVNDQFLSFADDKSGNILSHLLLQQDLKGKVEEPGFYFDAKEPKSDKALDYLLMTSGWRRFTWEKVMSDEIPNVAYLPEKAVVSGVVMDYYQNKSLPNATVKLNNGKTVITDSKGAYTFKNVELYEPLLISYSAPGFSNRTQYVYAYQENLPLYLYGNNQDYNFSRSSGRVRKAVPTAASISEMDLVDMVNHEAVAVEEKAQMPMKVKNDMAKNAPARLQPLAKAPLKKDREVLVEKMKASKANDDRDERFGAGKAAMAFDEEFIGGEQAQIGNATYYRARQFAAPIYEKQENVDTRTDFRNTIYWNPNVEVGSTGKKTIEFYMSDDVSSFRTTVEGAATDGTLGHGEKTIFTQLPFAMSTKIPVEVATEDIVSIPVTLKNNTDGPLGGELTITAPEGLQLISGAAKVQTIMPGKAKTIYLDYKVLNKTGQGEFTVAFKACGLGDAFTQKIKMVSKGFPVAASMSGQEQEQEFTVDMQHVVGGSIKASFTAYPNVVSDLMKGVEGILREPSGCFEQTSMSAYPNAMVLDYLKTTKSTDDKTLAYAEGLLDKGYKRLTTFETKNKGYEWFGAVPAHEGLTAFGIMEFVDMKNAGGDVDQKMIDRTADWLISQKDGKGGFKRESHAYHSFGSISDEIMNGYIVYALAEAGYTNIKNEFNSSYQTAVTKKDPYLLAMMVNAAYKLGDTKKAEDAMSMLISLQAKDGSLTGTTHSITYSQGKSLTIETTSIGILAMLKAKGKNAGAMMNAVQYLIASRDGYGVFGSTQGTVLALKALTEYAKASATAKEDGTINVYVDGKKVGEKSYKAGSNEPIVIEGLEAHLKEGKHTVKVKYVGVKNPLPYSVSVGWNTSLPESSKECVIDLSTRLASKSVFVGETVRLTATIKNSKNEGIPSTMAIIGIPAGLTVQPWQLKELQEKKQFDFYEIIGNNIALYYRGMAPGETREVNFDLKAEIPGEYDAPASSGYLYYTNEYKCWSAVDKIKIKKPQI
jgi:hypothetical protein